MNDKSDIKYLPKVDVHAGDTFFIAAGTVHGIGAGNLLVEVQESSNITYRLYDYDRVDKSGQRRELHLEKALAVANFKSSNSPRQPMHIMRYSQGCATEFMHRCKYFQVEKVMINTSELKHGIQFHADSLSFMVLVCIDGSGRMLLNYGSEFNVNQGQTIFFPADSEVVEVFGKLAFLKIRC